MKKLKSYSIWSHQQEVTKRVEMFLFSHIGISWSPSLHDNRFLSNKYVHRIVILFNLYRFSLTENNIKIKIISRKAFKSVNLIISIILCVSLFFFCLVFWTLNVCRQQQGMRQSCCLFNDNPLKIQLWIYKTLVILTCLFFIHFSHFVAVHCCIYLIFLLANGAFQRNGKWVILIMLKLMMTSEFFEKSYGDFFEKLFWLKILIIS